MPAVFARALTFALVLPLMSCDKPQIQEPADVVVTTLGSAFSPTLVYVSVGRSIRFDILGATEGHSVVFLSQAGAPENIPLTVQGSVYRKFDTKGTFHYECGVHPDMKGQIVAR